MVHFKFNRTLFIVVACLLLVGAMVATKTFVASPTHAASPTQNKSEQAKRLLFAISNTANCNVPNTADQPETLYTFHKGDQVSGLAEVVSSTDSTENMEEVLVLKETKGPFTATIIPNSGSHSFKFSAKANNDQLTACIKLIGTIDDESDLSNGGLIDHPAAVTLRVAPAGDTDDDSDD